MERSTLGRGWLNFGGITSTLDLEGLIVRLLAVNHSKISFKSVFISKCDLDGFGTENNKQVPRKVWECN